MNIKKLPKSLFVIFLFLMTGEISRLFVSLMHWDIETLTATQSFIISSVTDILVLIILIALYFKDLKEDLKEMKKDFNKNTETGFKYWLVGIIIMVTTNIIIALFLKEANAGNEEKVQEIIKSTGFISLITIGIIGPAIEELVFRKAFRDFFKNKYLFVITSGIIFGGLHVILSLNSAWDLFYLIPYCSLGIAFGLMYIKTNNIYTSMFMHMFHNTAFTAISVISAGVILW